MREKGIDRLQNLVSEAEKRYLSFQEIQMHFLLSNAHYLAYCQMLNFLKTRLRDVTHEVSPNKFDNLLGPSTANHTLAILYRGIYEATNKEHPLELFGKWEREFPDKGILDEILIGWRQLCSTVLNGGEKHILNFYITLSIVLISHRILTAQTDSRPAQNVTLQKRT